MLQTLRDEIDVKIEIGCRQLDVYVLDFQYKSETKVNWEVYGYCAQVDKLRFSSSIYT